MLELGIFGGKYMTDCFNEFPKNWFDNAVFSKENKNISILIILKLMLPCPYLIGKKRVGFLKMILEDGFSGIAGILWEEGWLMRIFVKLRDGNQWLGT